jgi:hypothetical protein
MGSIYQRKLNRALKRSTSRCFVVNSLKPKSLKYNRIILSIVDLMRALEKQGLFHRYAHQDESKARIEEEAKLLDEAIQRFDVSSAGIFIFFIGSPRVIDWPDKHANQRPSGTTMHEGCAC